MLYEIMKSIRNFFPVGRMSGTYKIESGTISLSFVSEGQYILIEGSTFNDGVYQYPMTGLVDESFSGMITLLAPPKEFLELVKEIEEYSKKYEETPFTSESFAGYSYSKKENASWKNAYASRLKAWRKL